MSIYKYMPAESAQRFLSTWALRITPPDQFNDPFEMCPPIEFATEKEIFSPDTLRVEFASRLTRDLIQGGFSGSAAASFSDELLAYLLRTMTAEDEAQFLQKNSRLRAQLPAMRTGLEQSLAQAKSAFPEITRRVESSIHQSMRDSIGTLCMSRNGCHPLMWAHYAQEHRGVVIEFDEAAPCFQRARSEQDQLGTFRPVRYSVARPLLDGDTGDDWFERLALTKAIEWAYEDEVRLLLMLSAADRSIGAIHLIDIAPAAVRAITFGCRAERSTIDMVKGMLAKRSDTSHVRLARAHVDKTHFALNYGALD